MLTILLKFILIIFSLSNVFFLKLLNKEYKLFNKNIETKNTSLSERILINTLILTIGIFIISFLSFSLISVFSEITIKLPF